MGEFAARDLELAADIAEVTERVADDVHEALQAGRTSALLFGCSVAHANHLADAVRDRGHSCEVITGETEQMVRQSIIGRFRRRELAALASCDVLTTGFDAPVVDVLAIVRATQSTSLYQQIVGRGMRIADSKTDCMILDYGGNVARHGPVDAVRVKEATKGKGDGDAPVKICPVCQALQPTSARACSECDSEFPPPEKKANAVASNLPILSRPATKPTATIHEVTSVRFAVHRKKGNSEAPSTMRVEYYNEASFLEMAPVAVKVASEWVCIEHDGFAYNKAVAWWKENVCSVDMPDTASEAVALMEQGYMRRVVAIKTVPDGDYTRIVAVDHGPALVAATWDEDEEIPF